MKTAYLRSFIAFLRKHEITVASLGYDYLLLKRNLKLGCVSEVTPLTSPFQIDFKG